VDPADLNALQLAGVYDPEAAGSEERLKLIEHLVRLGASVDAMVEADSGGRLRSLGGDLSLFDIGSPITVRELALKLDVPIETVMRIRMASGFPAEEDSLLPGWLAESVEGFERAAAIFGEPALLAFSRVMGASASRVAEAALGLFLTEVEAGFSAPGITDLDRARAVEAATGMFSVISQSMTNLLREHMMLAVHRQRAGARPAGPVAAGTCIGFVDLVASTEWSASMPLRAQADAVARFESAAWDIVTGEDARIVKLIGDEVMFMAVNPLVACRIALRLCEAVEAEPSLPSARGAVGLGDVVDRDGDYYGPLVNLVARAVKSAAPGEVVVTRELRDECEERSPGTLTYEALGSRTLRGIDQAVELFGLRPPGA
jgi:adenylate cyclase